nr:hypothetical protein [Proteus mirabilis]
TQEVSVANLQGVQFTGTVSLLTANDDKERCGDKKTYTERVPMTESYVADINQEDRKTFYTSCMSLKGWEQKNYYFWQ